MSSHVTSSTYLQYSLRDNFGPAPKMCPSRHAQLHPLVISPTDLRGATISKIVQSITVYRSGVQPLTWHVVMANSLSLTQRTDPTMALLVMELLFLSHALVLHIFYTPLIQVFICLARYMFNLFKRMSFLLRRFARDINCLLNRMNGDS